MHFSQPIYRIIHKTLIYIGAIITIVAAGCSSAKNAASQSTPTLTQKIAHIASSAKGRVGIAIITPSADTITINNSPDYPLMSVFKLHQALATAHHLDMLGISLDTLLTINRNDLDPDTWSPMLKDFPDENINISVADLMRYTLKKSDNNASNEMFRQILPVADVDAFIHSIPGTGQFQLSFTKAEMRQDHERSRKNNSTPLACAILIDKVYNDSIVSAPKQEFIRTALEENFITDRLAAPFSGRNDIKIGHKTGSGYRDKDGRLMAHNDVGHISLPDGRQYSIAVLVTDFYGTEQEAAEVIAEISHIVFSHFISKP